MITRLTDKRRKLIVLVTVFIFTVTSTNGLFIGQ